MPISAAEAAPVFAALGDRTRLTLLARIGRGEGGSVATLAVDTGMTRQAVAKHLRVLEGAGLVTPARAGRITGYAVKPAAVVEVQAYLADVSAQWDDTLGRLKALVERKVEAEE